jgi:hypothetical protein
MTRYFKVAGLALLALLTFAPFASAQRARFAFRGYFGPGFYGPSFYGGWYGPGWYGPGSYGLGWYEPYGYVPANAAGKVKIETKAKDAEVYVDGGYAGTVKQLGTFPLKAGAHDVELRDPHGQSFYQQQIDVIAGKTVDIRP